MTTQIKRCTKAEAHLAVPYLERFISGADFDNNYAGLDIDSEKLYNTLVRRENDPSFHPDIVLHDGEIVGALCAEIGAPFYAKTRIAYDHILYIFPDFQHPKLIFRLINRYRDWAKGQGADKIILSSSTGHNFDGFTKLCQRMGFEQTGGIFEDRS